MGTSTNGKKEERYRKKMENSDMERVHENQVKAKKEENEEDAARARASIYGVYN